jgi:hypothetical protein
VFVATRSMAGLFCGTANSALMSVRGDGGSSERVSLRHHDPHLALEQFRPGAAHSGTSFLSATLIGRNNTMFSIWVYLEAGSAIVLTMC